MKPKYTVRLTQELDDDERLQIAQRVAGVTDIDADKIERLLERGLGKDLIKPSGANVANRLASVLAEAGAPVQLVPVTEPEPVPAEAVESTEVEPEVEEATEPAPEAEDEPVTEDEAVLRPRAETPPSRPMPAEPEEAEEVESAAEHEPAWAEDAIAKPVEPVEPELPEPEPESEAPERLIDAAPAAAEPGAEELPAQEVEEKKLESPPEPAAPAAASVGATPEPDLETKPEPRVAPEPQAAPQADRQPRPEPARDITSPPPPEGEARGSGLLGAIGAALLGVGAFLSLGFIANPIGIGIVVLALLALGLSFVGQRRAIWLPGLGALALVVWALANADAGVMPTLASNWQWFAMFAGSLLVIVAGAQEAQRGYGP